MLEIQQLTVSFEKKIAVNCLSFTLNTNEFFVIMGPNGSGKSTIIKAIMQQLPFKGKILLHNQNVCKLSLRDVAKQLGVLLQRYHLTFDNTVYDIVTLGRYIHLKGMFGKLNQIDRLAIEEAMHLTNITSLKEQQVATISGGELQRVFLALVLAQDPDILLLDEPTNHLDMKFQIEILDILNQWRKKENKAILAIIHDVLFTNHYADRVLLLKMGTEIACGQTKEIMTPENLKKTYDFDLYTWIKKRQADWR